MKEWESLKLDKKVMNMLRENKTKSGIPISMFAEQSILGNLKKGGFRKIADHESQKLCQHPEHEPPMHIALEPGTYEYECPSCGHKKIINVPRITF